MNPHNKAVDIPLHDIKGLIEVPDYSIYYFTAAVIVGLLIIAGVFYLLYRYLKYKNRYNIRKEHLKAIRNIDMNDTKKAAYELTRYGLTFRDDSPRHQKHYELMLHALDAFKYKKKVDAFDSETLRHIHNYEEMLDV